MHAACCCASPRTTIYNPSQNRHPPSHSVTLRLPTQTNKHMPNHHRFKQPAPTLRGSLPFVTHACTPLQPPSHSQRCITPNLPPPTSGTIDLPTKLSAIQWTHTRAWPHTTGGSFPGRPPAGQVSPQYITILRLAQHPGCPGGPPDLARLRASQSRHPTRPCPTPPRQTRCC